MIRTIEDVGFDSIWTGDHFLYRMADGSADAPWDAWSLLAAAAAITSRVRNRAARHAGRLLQPGRPGQEGGHGRRDLRRPADPGPWRRLERGRVPRLRRSVRPPSLPLRGGVHDHSDAAPGRARSTSKATYFSARDCELVPRSRPGGPPILIGSVGRADARDHAAIRRRPGTSGTRTPATAPDGVAPLKARVAAACAKVGRDPATVDATVVGARPRMPGGKGRRQGDYGPGATPEPLQGPPEAIAEELTRLRPSRRGRGPARRRPHHAGSRSRPPRPCSSCLDRG